MQPDTATTSSGATSITTGDIRRGIVGSPTITGSIDFGDKYINNTTPTVLHASSLRHVPEYTPDIQYPSKLNDLFQIWQRTWVIVLEAPPAWGTHYVAEALAQRYIKEQPENRPNEIYISNGEVNGKALLYELEDRKGSVMNHAVLIENATRALYPTEIIADLRGIAEELKTPLILLTQENGWGELFGGEGFFRLEAEAVNPYTVNDRAVWLCRLLAKSTRHLLLEDGSQVTPETKIGDGRHSISDVAARLKSPGLVTNFPSRFSQLPPNADVKPLLDRMVEEGDTRVQEWFDSLQSDEARYVVLTLSLLDSLPTETFWALYEQLSLAWRERIISLTMSDYQSIRRELQEYILIDDPREKRRDTRIEFKNPSIRGTLISYASQGYRRSLVQALPVLGGIVTGERRTDSSESIVARLRELDILGSELEWLAKTRDRQNELRQRLIGSIVQILQFEPMTTQHLLLSWAESSSHDDVISFNRRRAFIEVLVRLYKSQESKEGTVTWHETRDSTFFLLHEWYQRFQPEILDLLLYLLPPAQREYQGSKEMRRANVRSSIASTICELSEIVRDEAFGSDAETQELLRSVPKEQPTDVKSLWHMLVALAWDRRRTVRLELAIDFIVLRDYHPNRFQALLNLLAADWQPVVRAQVARTLSVLVNRQSDLSDLYLINDLLDQDRPYFSRKIADPTHYLKLESLASDDVDFPEQLWTGLLAMLFVCRTNPTLLTVLLHTRLQRADSPYMSAFRSVMEWLFEDGNETTRGDLARVLVRILLDRTGDNRASEASLALEDIINNKLDLQKFLKEFLSKSEQDEFKAARDIPEYI